MKNLVRISVLALSALMFQGCFLFFDDDCDGSEYYPILTICKFKEDDVIFYDNAWVTRNPSLGTPYYLVLEWLPPPYPLGDNYYIWYIYPKMMYPNDVVYLSISREDWNDGNQTYDNGMIVCDSPFCDFIHIPIKYERIVSSHIHIVEDSLEGKKHKWIEWADTAWFRYHFLNTHECFL